MNLKIASNFVLGAMLALILKPSRGIADTYFGVQASVGNTTIKTEHVDEINKSGVSKFGKISLGAKYGTKLGLDLNVGLGINYTVIKGSSDTLQKQQAGEAAFPFVDLTAHVFVWPGLLLGGVIRNTCALGATYSSAEANKMACVFEAGPSAFLTMPIGSLDFLAGAIYLADINNPQREVKSVYYSVGINYSSKATSGPSH